MLLASPRFVEYHQLHHTGLHTAHTVLCMHRIISDAPQKVKGQGQGHPDPAGRKVTAGETESGSLRWSRWSNLGAIAGLI